MNNFKELLDQADISPTEASRIFNVSRPTIYAWLDGHVTTIPIVQQHILRVMDQISRAIGDKELPILKCGHRDLRVDLIRQVLAQY